jgi:hypothetical protein
MAYSYVSYAGNGSTTQFAVPFLYLRREHVTAQVNSVNTAFTWINSSTIQFASAPANGAEVRIRRVTPISSALVDFTDGSTIVAADLDTANLQHLFTEQELSDSVGPLSDIRGVYYGAYAANPATDPYGLPPDTGDQYFNTTNNAMRVYNGVAWQDASPYVSIVRWKKTAAGGETSLSGADDNSVTLSYTQGFEQVYLNGVLLIRGTEYTATNGSSLTGLAALTAGDVVEVLAYSSAVIALTTLSLNSGTAAAPSIAFASDTDTGIYRPGANELGFATNGSLRLSIDSAGNAAFASAISAAGTVTGGNINGVNGSFSGSVTDAAGNVRAVPQNAKTAAYTIAATDAGKHISITTGGITVPSGVFVAGDAVSIYNNSGSSQTITQGASVTVRWAGTSLTGNRTLGQYGLCTVLCVASNVFVISGTGLT